MLPPHYLKIFGCCTCPSIKGQESVDTVDTVETGDEGDHYGKDRAEAWNTLWKVTVARGVKEYFQIECHTRGYRSIFKLNGQVLNWCHSLIFWCHFINFWGFTPGHRLIMVFFSLNNVNNVPNWTLNGAESAKTFGYRFNLLCIYQCFSLGRLLPGFKP